MSIRIRLTVNGCTFLFQSYGSEIFPFNQNLMRIIPERQIREVFTVTIFSVALNLIEQGQKV